MRNVTRETSNPFGMRPPCPHRCGEDTERRAVFGYGDANADFHVVGDHPGVHGGAESGIPFTGARPGERLLGALDRAGLVERGDDPDPRNCYLSYRHPCCVPDGEAPSPEKYARFDRFLDAELRAISAHVLLPVGEPTTRHVIEEYTAAAHRIDFDMEALHATEVRGRGFLVMPIADPRAWEDHADRLVAALEALMARDYEQLADLGRFLPGGDPYFVR